MLAEQGKCNLGKRLFTIMLEEAEEEAMEDLAQLEPTIIIIKEEDNKLLGEETTSEAGGAIEIAKLFE